MSLPLPTDLPPQGLVVGLGPLPGAGRARLRLGLRRGITHLDVGIQVRTVDAERRKRAGEPGTGEGPKRRRRRRDDGQVDLDDGRDVANRVVSVLWRYVIESDDVVESNDANDGDAARGRRDQ